MKVESDGKFAEFDQYGGRFNKIDCNFEPVVERVALYSGGLVSQRLNIYKVTLQLHPGRYAFRQFEQPPLHKFPIPGKVAYYFEVK